MKKYRKRPIVVEAEQWTGDVDAIRDFCSDCDYIYIRHLEKDVHLCIKTSEGIMEVPMGDYIIKEAKEKFYLCKKDIFDMTYNLVEEEHEDPYAY